MKSRSSREEENAARRSERSREEENAARRYPTSLDRGVARGVRRVRRLGVRGVALPLVQMNQSSERVRSHSLGVVVLKKKRTREISFSRVRPFASSRRRSSASAGLAPHRARRFTRASRHSREPAAREGERTEVFLSPVVAPRVVPPREDAAFLRRDRERPARSVSVQRRGSLLRARAGMKRKAHARTLASACAFHPPPELRLIRRSCRCTPRRRRFACARRPWARRRSRGSPGPAPFAPPCPPPSPRADAPSPGPPSLGFSPRCAS